MPFFTVVIPSYNRANLIARTLDSVLAQTFTDFDILVVDDGSTDDTCKVVERYSSRVKLIRQSNAGPGVARNLGIQHATGDYIAFHDSDDLLFPWSLASYHQAIIKNNHPAMLAGSLIEFHDEGELASVTDQSSQLIATDNYYESVNRGSVNYVGAGHTVLRRDVAQQSGGFTPLRINMEDHDLAMRLGTAPGFVRMVMPWTSAYRKHTSNATGDNTKTYDGLCYLIKQEQRGAYPGDATYRQQRLSLISQHLRAVAAECLKRRQFSRAWYLYRTSFLWHIGLGKLKFLVGFPVIAGKAAIT